MRFRRRRNLIASLAPASVLALAAGPLSGGAVSQTTDDPPTAKNPLAGDGMWIWYLNRSSHGNVGKIAAKAHSRGIETVLIKSGDGTHYWGQFTSSLVSQLHARGLNVCAWQFIYGRKPGKEARVGAAAAARGADCLVMAVEGQYEGRYPQASTYMAMLRSMVGADYPVGLASFPYVDYHPALPYSVFLGPGGAQFNLPQVYWKAIGGGVDAVFDHTLRFNRPYGRPIMPLGQLYDSPPDRDVAEFRALATAAGLTGLRWWDWQHAGTAQWNAIAAPLTTPAQPPATGLATLATGSKGDLVVWAQEHLSGVTPSGKYDSATANAVAALQTSAGLPVTGQVDSATWPTLVAQPVVVPDWSQSASTARASAASARSGPPTASLPAKRDEVPGGNR